MNEPSPSPATDALQQVGARPESITALPSDLSRVEARATRIVQRSQRRVRAAIAATLVTVVGIGVGASTRSRSNETILATPTEVAAGPSQRDTYAVTGSPAWTRTKTGDLFTGQAGSSGLVKLQTSASTLTGQATVTSAAMTVPWPLPTNSLVEVIVTSARTPTNRRRDALFGVEAFASQATVGCRLLPDVSVTCASYDSSDGKQIGGGRLAQWSWFESAASTVSAAPGGKSLDGCTTKVTTCQIVMVMSVSSSSIAMKVNGMDLINITNIPNGQQPVGPKATAFVGVTAGSTPITVEVQ